MQIVLLYGIIYLQEAMALEARLKTMNVNILPPYIIEKIREYEEQRRRQAEENRPRVWIPLPDLPRQEEFEEADEEQPRVIIIDMDTGEEEYQ